MHIGEIIHAHFGDTVEIEQVNTVSKGLESTVQIVYLSNDTTLVVKQAKSKNTTSANYALCAQVLQVLHQHQVVVPQVLFHNAEQNYIIESSIGTCDLSDIDSKQWYALPAKFWQDLGVSLKNMHSIATSNFGPLQSATQGQHKSWYTWFAKMDHYLAYAKQAMQIDQNAKNKVLYESICTILQQMQFYLQHATFEPCLLHADVCSNNIRVTWNDQEDHQIGKAQFAGLIDVADAMSGDKWYDLGRLLSHVQGEWKYIFMMQYDILLDIKVIRGYAVYFALWMMYAFDNVSKYSAILQALVQLPQENQ